MTDAASIAVLRDGRQRRINYLRLSITDRCDLRCLYCMPAEGEAFMPRDQIMSDQEIMTLGRVAVGLGIRKIRITGGEPLLRPGVVDLLGGLRALPGLERLVLTTNGLKLAGLAHDLRAAGIEGVNISIDSLSPERYAEITRGGRLSRCLEGIEAALDAGFYTKLNMVVMRGINDDEIVDLASLAQHRPLSVRFIEYMPTRGRGDEGLTVPSDEVFARLGEAFTLEDRPHEKGSVMAGPARNYRIVGGEGSVGVISPVSKLFCSSCNRIRVGADGTARGCLFLNEPVDLRKHIQAGDEAALAAALLDIVQRKPERHDLHPDGHRDGDDPVAMSRMGG